MEPMAKMERADVIFCPANLAPVRKPALPLVLMVRNVAPLYPSVRKMLKRYEGTGKALHMLALEFLTLASIRKADHVLCLSRATQELVKKWVPGTRSSVLYHGINPRFFPEASRPKRAPEGPFFVYVSNVYVYKGLEYLIEALTDDPSLPPVCVVGRPFDHGYHAAMCRKISESRLEDRLVMLGDVPYQDLPGWYSHAVALVYASWCENCPNILLEAMACGCPVVAMKIGPMPEIVGNAGWYARPFDGASLKDAMRLAWHHSSSGDKKRKALARSKEFGWERSLSVLLDSFHSFQ